MPCSLVSGCGVTQSYVGMCINEITVLLSTQMYGGILSYLEPLAANLWLLYVGLPETPNTYTFILKMATAMFSEKLIIFNVVHQ